MQFRNFNSIGVFITVAKHLNMGQAADELSITKGAVSYQIQQLETALKFKLFERANRKLSLTREGAQLAAICTNAYADIEREIARITHAQLITIGVATYFASRWLSPKLMNFMREWPDISLRINPLIDLIDVRDKDVDILIRWGKGDWHDPDMQTELIMNCPAMLTASRQIGDLIEQYGIESVLASVPLLHDRDCSSAWQDWFAAANVSTHLLQERLVIQDPNVRAQAVIDSQGIALYDHLINDEVQNGRLYQYTDVQLHDYGFYLLYPNNTPPNSPIFKFRDWLFSESQYVHGKQKYHD